MSNPRVSVIIGTWNRAAVIRETIDSVLAQTWPNLEILVVDDASTDATPQILQTYRDAIRLTILPQNSGRPAVPRNVALRQMTGHYAAFLDSDDRWEPDKLTRQVAYMQQHPDLGMSHHYTNLISATGQPLGIRHEGTLPQGIHNLLEPLLQHCFISISSVLVPRHVIDRIGLMHEDPFYRAREDYEWFLRIARDHPIGLLPGIWAHYRRADTSISGTDTAWRMQPEDAPMHRRILQRPELWQNHLPRHRIRNIFLNACTTNIIHWRERRQPTRALWFAALALRHAPFHPTTWNQTLRTLARTIL